MTSFDPFHGYEFDPQNGGFRPSQEDPLAPLVSKFEAFSDDFFGKPHLDPKGDEGRVHFAIKTRMQDTLGNSKKAFTVANPYLALSPDGKGCTALTTLYDREFAVPLALFGCNGPFADDKKKRVLEVLNGGIFGVVFTVPRILETEPIRTFILVDEEAFALLERDVEAAKEEIFFRQAAGKQIHPFLDKPSALASLALLKGHRYGRQNPSTVGAQRIHGKFTGYDFDPSRHLHQVDIHWSELPPDPSAKASLIPKLDSVRERTLLRMLPDENSVVRADVVDVQRN